MKNAILLILALIIVLIPILMIKDAEFAGADSLAEGMITEINESYEPWFESLWEPPSGEIESLLFALQAAMGALFIGYYFGMLVERRRAQTKS